jgi:hypothetical protein
VRKAITNDDMFANGLTNGQPECRLGDELKHIKNNDVCVIDIAKLPEDKQAFVFGDAVRTIYNLKLGEYDAEDSINPPTRIVIFIDELNKYASKDVPKTSPILREILDVTERGRSLGVVLFGAEQFRSAIHERVTGNCATHAYGRTNSIETSQCIAWGQTLNFSANSLKYQSGCPSSKQASSLLFIFPLRSFGNLFSSEPVSSGCFFQL